MSREEAARIGGMNRQTPRDWVHRFNALGPDGLADGHRAGRKQQLSAKKKAGRLPAGQWTNAIIA